MKYNKDVEDWVKRDPTSYHKDEEGRWRDAQGRLLIVVPVWKTILSVVLWLVIMAIFLDFANGFFFP